MDNKTYIKEAEQKLKKEQDELSKIDTGIAKVFLQDRERDRENLRHRAANVDPRNASRTPSAAREPTYRLRYESPVGACKLHFVSFCKILASATLYITSIYRIRTAVLYQIIELK